MQIWLHKAVNYQSRFAYTEYTWANLLSSSPDNILLLLTVNEDYMSYGEIFSTLMLYEKILVEENKSTEEVQLLIQGNSF